MEKAQRLLGDLNGSCQCPDDLRVALERLQADLNGGATGSAAGPQAAPPPGTPGSGTARSRARQQKEQQQQKKTQSNTDSAGRRHGAGASQPAGFSGDQQQQRQQAEQPRQHWSEQSRHDSHTQFGQDAAGAGESFSAGGRPEFVPPGYVWCDDCGTLHPDVGYDSEAERAAREAEEAARAAEEKRGEHCLGYRA